MVNPQRSGYVSESVLDIQQSASSEKVHAKQLACMRTELLILAEINHFHKDKSAPFYTNHHVGFDNGKKKKK